MNYDPFFKSLKMPDGRTLYGCAAFNRRVKLCGGPKGFFNLIAQITLDHMHNLAEEAAVNIAPTPRGKVIHYEGGTA